jgi:hypothetical protein
VELILFFGLRIVPDVRCKSQPHQGALCCIVSVGPLPFLNRKTEKQKKRSRPISVVGDLCFDACFSQLEPKPPSGGQEKQKQGKEKEREFGGEPDPERKK